jgi:hypothetical protein
MTMKVIVTVLLGSFDQSNYLAGPSGLEVDFLPSLDY